MRADITIAPFNGIWPRIHDSAFIASGCRIIGDVEIGPESSIWYNCVIRADINHIRIGARSNIQDGTIIHCDSPKETRPQGFPTIIGDDVLVGHLAIIHGCALESRAFVGMGAVVMDGCIISSDAMLAAGALLSPGKVIPSRQMWMGRPAAFARELTEAALEGMAKGITGYVANAKAHKASLDGALDGALGG
jgi:carbonic anhydrase/acetyltransferase-like protein (isoleucine patch superfamily)